MIIINLILVTWTRDNSKKDDAAILFLLLWRSWVYLPSQDTKATVPVCTYPHSITAVSHTVGKENNPFGKLAEEGWEGLGTTKFLSHTWSERLSWQPKDIKRHSESSECNNRLWNKLCSTYTAGLRTQSSTKPNTHPSPPYFQDNLILWFFYCAIIIFTQFSEPKAQ